MTGAVPEPYEFVLLALGAYRTWKLVADDDVLDRPRGWLVERLGDRFDAALVCPWCAGLWVTYGIYAAWLAAPDWTLVYTALMGISALVGLAETARSRISD